jgi:phenylalanyl-tRNA synthetase beta chain
MKISYNWLKEYVDIAISPAAVSDLLTNIGLEVEGETIFERVRGGLRGLVIGEVLTCERHPNADKLSLTTVSVGGAEALQIVCGAPNVAAGQKVVVATEGTQLYPADGEPFVIKKGKIRGEASMGMICAEDEIGMGESHAGIIVLPADAPVGQPYAEYVGLSSDVVWDINLTPNRADATNHIGVAFDLAAAMQIQQAQKPNFRRPAVVDFGKIAKATPLPIDVQIIDNEGCSRYTGLVMSGVKVGAAPAWLQERLKAIGINPTNNIVDITNFVLHETGQPLHAFDYAQISGAKVQVQTLAEGTAFTTLDGTERKLNAADLMICDGNGAPLCIAGVFGGKNSGVSEQTTTIFLESAFFQPTQVRRTSLRHQLRTDAATRFEKTTDINQTLYALQRAALLIAEIAGGQVASNIVDIYPKIVDNPTVQLSYKNISRLLGVQIPASEVQQILVALEMRILHENSEGVLVSVPTNKVDVSREADVIEEILRIYGYNRIESPTTVSSVLAFSTRPNSPKVKNLVADALSARGFAEMMATSMTKSSYFANTALAEKLVFVNNTSNQHLDVMRPTMIYSGLEAIAHNQNRQNPSLKLYEFGKTYAQFSQNEQLQYQEEQHLSVFMTGDFAPQSWLQTQAAPTNFYHLKNTTEFILQRLGLNPQDLQAHIIAQGDENTTFAYGLSLQRGKQIVAQFGRLQPALSQALSIRQAVFFADIHWDTVLKMIEKNKIQYQPLPKYPAVRRDLAIVLDSHTPFAKVAEIAQKQAKKLLKDISLFDVFEDKEKVGEGKKSYAVSFLFQDNEKTLRDQDIEKIINDIINALDKQLQANIRK